MRRLRRRFLAVARIDKRANDHDAGHLAVRAGGRLQRNARQSGDFGEMLLKFVNDFQRALRFCLGSERMQICKARDTRDLFIQARVVLHRARAERVHALIDRIIPGRDAREVTNHVDFSYFGHAFEIVVALKLAAE